MDAAWIFTLARISATSPVVTETLRNVSLSECAVKEGYVPTGVCVKGWRIEETRNVSRLIGRHLPCCWAWLDRRTLDEKAIGDVEGRLGE